MGVPRSSDPVVNEFQIGGQVFQLPFTVESPLGDAVVAIVIGLVCTAILYSHGRSHRITRRLVDLRFSGIPLEKRHLYFRRLVLTLAIIFFSMSIFGFAVASGLLVSKKQKAIPIDQFLREVR